MAGLPSLTGALLSVSALSEWMRKPPRVMASSYRLFTFSLRSVGVDEEAQLRREGRRLVHSFSLRSVGVDEEALMSKPRGWPSKPFSLRSVGVDEEAKITPFRAIEREPFSLRSVGVDEEARSVVRRNW